jgi:hypothetical protein
MERSCTKRKASRPEAFAEPFYRWRDDSLTQGEPAEYDCELEYLAENVKDVLAKVKLRRVKIWSSTQEKVESHPDDIRRLAKAKMYVEEMTLTLRAE